MFDLSSECGEFVFARSEAQVQILEVGKELEEIRTSPQFELAEMADLLMAEGVTAADAGLIAKTLSRHPHAYAKTMVEKELGILLAPEVVRIPEAATMGASYLVAAIVPLIVYFFLSIQPRSRFARTDDAGVDRHRCRQGEACETESLA